MNIDKIKNHIAWEQYYDPNFDWGIRQLYVNNRFSEKFIKEFKDKVNWTFVSLYQVLSEDFIREFKDNVNWTWISMAQILSEDFIIEFKYKVDWNLIWESQELSDEFKKQYQPIYGGYCAD